MVDHVSCFINRAQFGFMQNRSTTQQLLLFLHNAFSYYHQFDAIYLDSSKAVELSIQFLILIYYLNFITLTFQVAYDSGFKLTSVTDFNFCLLITVIPIIYLLNLE